MNFLGLAAVVLSLIAFTAAYRLAQHRSLATRILLLGSFTLLAAPSLLFAIYYLHIWGEHAWFYTLRSWPSSEFLVVFLGCAGGLAATFLPRPLLRLPLFAGLATAIVPYIKPLIGPLPDSAFHERWQGDVCMQSTPSTCGPASVTTILRRWGVPDTEQATARAAFSYSGGTEAWYLARYVRHRGLSAHFDFRPSFSPNAGLPAVVGVRLGSVGHFIAVLDREGDQITFADPMRGEEHLSVAEFQRRYDFTGFHLVIQRL